ncbi:MAG TPA: protein kinase [Pyrinomonadaceae bacterium]|jgi:serine/threonine protein kinase|nr:protein kinase [Pyrinomonadaceae bacterium]
MIAPGTVLQNRYRVERQIGEGGMGAVYVATDERFGSTVALKETLFDDPSLRKAFEREARLLNHLRHTALPRVSDHFGEDEGQFLVMEYIPGEDLSDMLKERAAAFPVPQVLAWADQLLDALEYLHTQEPPVIHRDIKPQNIKLLPRNQVVLLDFGLAKGAPLQTRVTATGSVFGYSFNYAPIEQMQGAGTDPRSDLYSLGATLYHLLTATTPPDALTRATAVLNGEPDPLKPANELNARVPAEVAQVLARAMSQSAARRFRTAEEMRAAFREAGQRAAIGREATAADASTPQPNLPGERTSLSENETRLLDAPVTNRLPLAETEELLEETAFAPRHDAATLASAKAAGNEKTAAVEGGEQTAAPARRDEKSEVTRVSTSQDAGAARRKGSRRAVVAAMCIVAVALVAVAVYSFARRAPRAVDANAQAPTAGQSAQPPPTETQEQTQPAPTNADSGKSSEASPANESAHAAAPARHATPAPDRNARPREESRPAEENVPPAPPPAAPPPERAAGDDEENPFRGRDWARNPPSDEEIQRWVAQHPGWLEQHPNRARMLRKRVMQEQRRRRNNQQPPFQQPPP